MKSEDIIDQLIENGKITREDIVAIQEDRIKKELLNNIHLVVCKLNHNNGECRWYEEKIPFPGVDGQVFEGGVDAEGTWSKPFHAEWLRLFNDFLASTKLIKFIPESVAEESSGGSND